MNNDNKMTNVDNVYEEMLNSATLTDENINKINDFIEEKSTDDNKILEGLDSNNGILEQENDNKLQEDYVKATVDPITGKMNIVGEGEDTYCVNNLDDITELSNDEINLDVHLNKEKIHETINMIYPDIKLEDFEVFMNALIRYKDGQKFSYFNSLPEYMKNQINMAIGHNSINRGMVKEARKMITKQLFDQLIEENLMDQTFIDFQESIDKIYKETSEEITKEFGDYNITNRDYLENKLPEIAEQIRETDPEKAVLLMKMTEQFRQSYTYEHMVYMYLNTGKLRVKKIDIEKFNRTCASFNHKYKESKFIVHDVSTLIPVINRHLCAKGYITSDWSDDMAKTFIVVFCKYTMNMKPENLDEHVFMYYFIKHILNLDYYDKNSEREKLFYDNLLESLYKAITDICLKTIS